MASTDAKRPVAVLVFLGYRWYSFKRGWVMEDGDGDGHVDMWLRLLLAVTMLVVGILVTNKGLVEDSAYMAVDAVADETQKTAASKPPAPSFGSHFDMGTR